MRHATLARIGLLVLTLLGAAGPARAAADLETVTFSLAVVRVENAVKTITARIEVAGQRITRASITPPGINPTTVDLALEGDVFALEDEFTSEADLTDSFPDGTYTLTLNGTTDYRLDLARAPIPSAAISAPLPAEVLVPGPVTVEFTRCSICDQEFDSTTGLLEDAGGSVIASDDTLAPGGSATALVDSMTAITLGTVAVEDARKLPSDHAFEVSIGSEDLNVSRLDDTHITVIDRGVGGTTPAAHAANDRVSEVGQSDTMWTPAIELAADTSFSAAIVHSVERADSLVGPGNDEFELDGSFSDEDSVSFFTGGAVPTGHFCVVVEDDGSLDESGECAVGGDELAALLDPSGTFPLPIAGVDMEYTSEVLPSGDIVGTAHADLDGNGSLESTTPLSGKVTGFAGKVQRNLGFAFKTLSPAAKLKVKIDESGVVTEGSLAGKQTAKGTVQGVKIKDSAPSTLPLGEEPLGWRLDVELAGKQVDDATVTLSDGRKFALTGRFLFDFLTGLAKLDLQSEGADEGVRVRIEDFDIEDLEAEPPVINGGDFTFKILGQRGRFAL